MEFKVAGKNKLKLQLLIIKAFNKDILIMQSMCYVWDNAGSYFDVSGDLFWSIKATTLQP